MTLHRAHLIISSILIVVYSFPIAWAQRSPETRAEDLRVGPIEATRSSDLVQIAPPHDPREATEFATPLSDGTLFQIQPAVPDTSLNQLAPPDSGTTLLQQDASTKDRCEGPRAEDEPLCADILEDRAKSFAKAREARIAADRARTQALFKSNSLVEGGSTKHPSADPFDAERRLALGDVTGSQVAQSVGNDFLFSAPTASPPESDPLVEDLLNLPTPNILVDQGHPVQD